MLRKKLPPREASHPSWLRCALLALLVASGGLGGAGVALGQEKKSRPRKTGAAPVSTPPAGSPGDLQAAADPVREEILKVNYVFNRELYDLALPRYEKLLAENPDYARAELIHYPLALCHYNLAIQQKGGAKGKVGTGAGSSAAEASEDASKKQLRKAVTHLKESLKRKELESRSEATRLLGQCLLLLEDFDGAAKTFQWILDRSQDAKEAVPAGLGLADSHYFRADYARAADAYRQVVAVCPGGDDLDRAEFYLAMSLYRLGELAAAAAPESEPGKSADRRTSATVECIQLFETIAGKTVPENGATPAGKARSRYALESRYMLALARQAAGDAGGAVEAFRALAASGSNAGEYAELAQFGLATALFRAGKPREAAREIGKFTEAFPSSDRRDAASVYLARALLETGQPAPAAKMLQELRASTTVGDEASLWLARIFARHGKHRSAASVLRAALKDFPGSAFHEDIELELASAELGDGSFEAAGEVLARLEAGGNRSASRDHVAYLKAYALHRAKKYAESLAACAKLKESFPRSRYVKDAVQLEAENQLLAGDFSAARAAYEGYLEAFGKELDGPSTLKARFRAAQALYLDKKLAGARAELESLKAGDLDPEAVKAFQGDPLFAPYRYLLGDCAYQVKDYGRAREELDAFLKERGARGSGLEAEAADARFKLAHSLQLAGDLKSAREAYKHGLEVDPGSPHRGQMLFELGQIAYAEKDAAEAAKYFDRVLKELPASRFAPHALRFSGWIASEAKDPARAAASYRKLLAEFAEHPAAQDAEYQLALCLKDLGQTDEAREALSRFRARHPEDPRAARAEIEEAAALSREGKHREALDSLERIRVAKPGPDVLPALLYEIAWCHRGVADLEAARQAYTQLIDLDGAGPLRDTARLELGELELELKDYARAEEILAPIASAQGPQREKALYRLVWCRQMTGDSKGVAAAYEAFAKEFPSSELVSELALLAARAHSKNGDPEKAEIIFSSIAERKPEKPEAEAALVSLGECLLEERKFEEARARFQTFLERYPGSSFAYRARFGGAWADENLGQIDEAVEKYKQVVKESRTATAARAQFQLGQCLVARKDYKNAIVEFLQVPAAYSYPEWTSKALLQAAGCFEALEDQANARKYYSEVASTYPDRDEAKLATERIQKLETR